LPPLAADADFAFADISFCAVPADYAFATADIIDDIFAISRLRHYCFHIFGCCHAADIATPLRHFRLSLLILSADCFRFHFASYAISLPLLLITPFFSPLAFQLALIIRLSFAAASAFVTPALSFGDFAAADVCRCRRFSLSLIFIIIAIRAAIRRHAIFDISPPFRLRH
jgi:hypothetical protein